MRIAAKVLLLAVSMQIAILVYDEIGASAENSHIDQRPIGGWVWSIKKDCKKCQKEANVFKPFFKHGVSKAQKKVDSHCKNVANNVKTLKVRAEVYFCNVLRSRYEKENKSSRKQLQSLLKSRKSSKAICKKLGGC